MPALCYQQILQNKLQFTIELIAFIGYTNSSKLSLSHCAAGTLRSLLLPVHQQGPLLFI